LRKTSRNTSLVLALVLLVSVFTPLTAFGATEQTAQLTTSTVLVDGVSKNFEAYLIEGSNYFKLRDIAMVLDGTEKQFEVSWNDETRAIDITTGKAYTVVGGELEPPTNLSDKIATPSTAKIYFDGVEKNLTAYTINNNNYFKLRDLGAAVGFDVTWDNATKTVGISSTTTSEPEAESIAEPEAKTDDVFYYVNMTSDDKFFAGDPASYAIFKYDNGTKTQISTSKAYDLTTLGDKIYYMKIDMLERQDGFVQRGNLWQMDLDGKNDKAVIEDSILSIASDDTYLYFSADSFGDNIMSKLSDWHWLVSK
jgi:hypothetical protein